MAKVLNIDENFTFRLDDVVGAYRSGTSMMLVIKSLRVPIEFKMSDINTVIQQVKRIRLQLEKGEQS